MVHSYHFSMECSMSFTQVSFNSMTIILLFIIITLSIVIIATAISIGFYCIIKFSIDFIITNLGIFNMKFMLQFDYFGNKNGIGSNKFNLIQDIYSLLIINLIKMNQLIIIFMDKIEYYKLNMNYNQSVHYQSYHLYHSTVDLEFLTVQLLNIYNLIHLIILLVIVYSMYYNCNKIYLKYLKEAKMDDWWNWWNSRNIMDRLKILIQTWISCLKKS